MIFTPRDFQVAMRAFALEHGRVNWWAGTGTGKTSAALDLIDFSRMLGETRRTLVVSTKRVSSLVWPRELRKWENFSHLSIAVAIGSPDQRGAALAQRADITTINYDNLQWLAETVGDDWPWDTVIADESTRLKSLRIDMRGSTPRSGGGSKRAAAIAKVSHKRVRHWINLTGTPRPNGLQDLWGQQWFIDGGARLGRSFTAFSERWFSWVQTGSDAFQRTLKPHKFAEEQIRTLLADCTITIEAKDYFDLPPLVVNRIMVPLPAAAQKHYEEMEHDLFTTIREHGIEAVSAGAKSMKCRQLASGAVYVDNTGTWTLAHDAKIEALQGVVEEAAGEPIIVGYYFKSDLARLRKAFPQAVEFDDKAATLQRFIDGDIPLLLVHPKSASHGLDGLQQHCRTVVFFSLIWELEEYEQLIERVGAMRQVQAGHYRTVYVHLLIGEDTIDEDMADRLETKASMQDAMKAAMRKRG